MTSNRSDRIALIVGGLVIGAFASLMLILGTAPADAAEPDRATCDTQSWQAPASAEARRCRRAGWYVSGRLVVSPAGERRVGHVIYVDLPHCEYEDGSGQARCVWFAGERGNGRGHSFAKTSRSGFVYFRDGHRRY